MKKLMLVVAMVCAATMAKAGAANWSVLDVEGPDSGYAYLFNSATFAYDDFAATETVMASIKDGSFAEKYVANSINEEAIEGGELEVLKAYTGSGSTSLWMIAVDNAGDIKNFFVGEEVTMPLPTSSATKPYEWAYNDNTTAWTAVENVPEPTSGLLLLLGMAGLALKRKRA